MTIATRILVKIILVVFFCLSEVMQWQDLDGGPAAESGLDFSYN